MAEEIKEVLQAALESFGPNGKYWVQGEMKCFHPPFCCCATAIQRVDQLMKVRTEAHALLFRAIGDSSIPTLAHWNDAMGRTWPEVKELFEKAIAAA